MYIAGLEWKDFVKFSIHHRYYQWFANCPHQYLQGDSGFQLLPHQPVAKETREGKKILNDIQFQGSQDTPEKNFNGPMKEAEIGFWL